MKRPHPYRATRRFGRLLVLTVSLLASAAATERLAAQQAEAQPARNAFYVELLGNALFYSINYDRLLTEKVAARVGVMFIGGTDTDGTTAAALISPIMASYLWGSGNHHFETGVGLALGSAGIDAGEDVHDFSISGAYGTGTLGYRYQRPSGGLIVRAGATPIFSFSSIGPYFGLSLGYGF